MSGLAVLYNRDGRPADDESVWSMLRSASYRGPDGLAVRSLGSVSLGYAKSAIAPEDAIDRQPRISGATASALVADVRLDNREELLRSLPDALSPRASDSELILRAYEAWGLDMLPRLLGDFAFILWDPRHDRLVLARDTSGQRSLFYRAEVRSFAAASEIHQLFQDPTIPMRPNTDRLRDFLVPLNAYANEKDQAATFYEGVLAVPAGHVLTVTGDAMRLRRYWELPQGEIRYRNEDEYAQHYRDLFSEAVRARLRSARPMGALLSGGLDSSSVVATAQHLYRKGQATDLGFVSFTSTFDGLDCDESDLVRDLQAMYGFDARTVPGNEGPGRLQLEPSGFQESPNVGAPEARDRLMAAVSDAGVRVLLTGDIADACVAGSPLYLDSLLRKLRFGAFWRHFKLLRSGADEPLRRFFMLYVVAPLLPLWLHRRTEALHVERFLRAHGASFLPLWMPAELRDALAARHVELALETTSRRRFSNPARQLEFDMLYPPEVSRHPGPWAVDFSRPFADRRLHEFLLAIPPEVKYRLDGSTETAYAASKQVLRGAMRGLLPESIRMRKIKTTFSAVYESEIARDWARYEAAFGPGAHPQIVERGLVDHARFWSRLRGLRSGQTGADLIYLVHVMNVESWLRAIQLPWPRRVAVEKGRSRMAAPTGAEHVPAMSIA